jgi:hypothetical protein
VIHRVETWSTRSGYRNRAFEPPSCRGIIWKWESPPIRFISTPGHPRSGQLALGLYLHGPHGPVRFIDPFCALFFWPCLGPFLCYTGLDWDHSSRRHSFHLGRENQMGSWEAIPEEEQSEHYSDSNAISAQNGTIRDPPDDLQPINRNLLSSLVLKLCLNLFRADGANVKAESEPQARSSRFLDSSSWPSSCDKSPTTDNVDPNGLAF